MNAPGRGILKTASIIYMILGAIFALLMVLSLAIGPGLITLGLGSVLGLFGSILGGVLFLTLLVPAAVDLTVGILGLKRSGMPEKANFFIVIGIVLGALSLLSLFAAFTLWNLLGLVLPVLFIIGGFKNKRAVDKMTVT